MTQDTDPLERPVEMSDGRAIQSPLDALGELTGSAPALSAATDLESLRDE